MKKILVLDDEEVVLSLLRRLLPAPHFDLRLAGTLCQARDFLTDDPGYALLIADLRLPDGRGDDFIMEFQSVQPTGKVMVLSGHPDLMRDFPLLKSRGMGCLAKPFRPQDLLRTVKALIGDEKLYALGAGGA